MVAAPTTRVLEEALIKRILILDGAMGTMIQKFRLEESDFRGERFRTHDRALQGNNDVLVLTRPDVVACIHDEYCSAGADILETNTFNANAISQADYGLEALAYEINLEAAKLAKQAAWRWSRRTPQQPRWVAGSLGPTNRTLSLSPRVEDPAYRAVTFGQVRDAYAEQVRGLLDGGCDLLLAETSFDTLNLKACVFAIKQVFEEKGVELPIVLSMTVADKSGRTLSGQTLEAFWVSIAHARPFGVGINCSLGAREIRPYLADLAKIAPCRVVCYPNAGLPNAFGEYDETPEMTASLLHDIAQEGLVNIVGGCCGTTPEHVRAIAKAVQGLAPRWVPVPEEVLPQFSGLEPLTLRPDSNLILVGERTNVAGSKRFAELIKAKDYAAALQVALEQVRGGANILDINMDEALLDSEEALGTFLRYVASEPEIARLPIMIDSSKWSVLETGLQGLQGKGIVNSLSLKDGPEEFLRRAKLARWYGASVVVMAFDEQGQAETADRKVAICERAYRLLTKDCGFEPQDIIFDPAILAVGTGLEEHNRYALAFLDALPRIKKQCPGALLSGGVSNLSFAFRGNNVLREALHSAFLYHAIQRGLDLAIVNAGQLAVYEDIPQDLLERVEDVLLFRRPDATERLVEFAEQVRSTGKKREVDLSWRNAPVEQRLTFAMIHGVDEFIEKDCEQARGQFEDPLRIIEGPLLEGMKVVGELFGEGKMFLPQVVKSARVMKKAVAALLPYLQESRSKGKGQGKVLLATVKGDVHDIGKNIVGVVLGCNNYDVIDLGVLVPTEAIVRAARENQVDILGLSGLITPSLEEMVLVARELERQGVQMPLLIGGATTSKQHTAVRIAPVYQGPVVHVRDASRAATTAAALLDPARREAFESANRSEQQRLRAQHLDRQGGPLVALLEAREHRLRLPWKEEDLAVPSFMGARVVREVPLDQVAKYIDWTFFFTAWNLTGRFPQILEHPKYGETARELYASGVKLLGRIVQERLLAPRAVYGFWPANSDGDDIVLWTDRSRIKAEARFPMLRQQVEKAETSPYLCLADFVAPREPNLVDYVGAFAVTAGIGVEELTAQFRSEGDDYQAIAVQALADRLAEATAEWLHQQARRDWGFGDQEDLTNEELIAEKYRGIRPALGYPACPDHSLKGELFRLLGAETQGITLTETYAMKPAASVSGLYIAHPESRYFSVGRVGRDQVGDYAARLGRSVEEAERWLIQNLGYEK